MLEFIKVDSFDFRHGRLAVVIFGLVRHRDVVSTVCPWRWECSSESRQLRVLLRLKRDLNGSELMWSCRGSRPSGGEYYKVEGCPHLLDSCHHAPLPSLRFG